MWLCRNIFFVNVKTCKRLFKHNKLHINLYITVYSKYFFHAQKEESCYGYNLTACLSSAAKQLCMLNLHNPNKTVSLPMSNHIHPNIHGIQRNIVAILVPNNKCISITQHTYIALLIAIFDYFSSFKDYSPIILTYTLYLR